MRSLTVLVGCSSSGKDTVMNRLVKEFDVKPVISYTTRPIRDCEIDGREYHFITEKEFERMKDNDLNRSLSFSVKLIPNRSASFFHAKK